MTVTNTTRGDLDIKAGRAGGWDEAKHPRDRLGRFIETGAEVRVWGGQGGTVVGNVGGGRIEIERADGSHIIVHRNYLTVTKRPDGSAPTDQATDDVSEIDETEATADAEELDVDDTADANIDEAEVEPVAAALETVGGSEAAQRVRDRATAYREAVGNNIPDDEADERAALLSELAAVETEFGDAAGVPDAVANLRNSVRQEPTGLLNRDRPPAGVRDLLVDQADEQPEADGSAPTAAPARQRVIDRIDTTETTQIGGREVSVGDYARSPAGRAGWVVGFTDRGGAVIRDEAGDDWPYRPDAGLTFTAEVDIHRDDSIPGDMPEEWLQEGQEAPAGTPEGDASAPTVEAPETPAPEATPEGAVTVESLIDSRSTGRDKDQWYRLDWDTDRDDPDAHYAMNPAGGRPIRARAVNRPLNGTTTPGENDLAVHFTTDQGTDGVLELPPDARLVPIDPPAETTITGHIESPAGDYDGPLYLLGGGNNQFPSGTYQATGDDGQTYDVVVDPRSRTTVTVREGAAPAPEARPDAPETPEAPAPEAPPQDAPAARRARPAGGASRAVALAEQRARYRELLEQGDRPGLARIVDDETLSLSPNGKIAYYKFNRTQWVMLDAATGRALGSKHNSTWGGRRQADRLASLYSEVKGKDGQPFDWDRVTDTEYRRNWRSEHGLTIDKELSYTKGETDYNAGRTGTDAARVYVENRPTPETPDVSTGGDARLAATRTRLTDHINNQIAPTNPERADKYLARLHDPQTFISPKGEFVIHRSDEDGRQWYVSSTGDMTIAVKTNSRAEALAMATGIEGAVDADGNPFNFHDPDAPSRVRANTWRDTTQRTIRDVVRDVRASVPVSQVEDAEWVDPIREYNEAPGEPTAPPAPGDVAGSLNPQTNTDQQAFRRAMLDAFNFTQEETGWRTSIRYSPRIGGGGTISGNVVDRNGNPVGTVTRSVFINGDGKVEVHHDLLTISTEHQGQGFADAYYKHLYDQYEQRGIEQVTIQANIDVGGYAWAQRGFDWEDGTMPGNVRANVTDRLRALAAGDVTGWNGRSRVQSAAGNISDADKARIRLMADRLDRGEEFSPVDIANTLKDVEWQHPVGGGKTIRMWPGKHALLGINWNGSFDVSRRVGTTPSTPDRPRYVADGLGDDLTDVSIADLSAALMQQRLNLDAMDQAGVPRTDSDFIRATGRIERLNQYRDSRWRAEATRLGGPRGTAMTVSDLTNGDQFVLPATSGLDAPEVVTAIGAGDRSGVTYQRADGSTGVLRGGAQSVTRLGAEAAADVPEGSLVFVEDGPRSREEIEASLLAAFSYTHPESGWTTAFTTVTTQQYGDDRSIVSGAIRNADGQAVGQVQRSVFINGDGDVEVHHDLLTIRPEFQGQGFADAYYKHLYEQYEARGIDVVTINANIDVGGYAWAQRGFDWESGRMGSYHRGAIAGKLRELARYGDNGHRLTPEEKAKVTALAARLDAGEEFSPADIANALKDVEWTRRVGTKDVRMWPGKYAMLGMHWNGAFRVRGAVTEARPSYTVSDRDIATMTDEEIGREAEEMLGDDVINRLSDGGFDAEADAATARLTALRAEERRRYEERATAAIGTDAETVNVGDLSEGDEIVLPPVIGLQYGGPERVTVTVVGEPIEDAFGGSRRAWVRFDDDTERLVTFTRFSGMNVRRAAPASALRVEQTNWRSVRAGDTVMVTALDGYGQVPVSIAKVTPDGDQINATVVFPDGQVLDLTMDRYESVNRVHGNVSTVPEPPRPVGDLSDDEVREEMRALGRRYLGTALSEEERNQIQNRMTELVDEANRRQEAPDVPEPEQPIQPRPQSGSTARPALYTYQRKNIVALGLDLPDSGAPDDVQQAAARVRNRMPLTADQSAALADYLRGLADDPDTRIRRQRMLNRLAAAFDASSAQARGLSAPQPQGQGVTRGRPGALFTGDLIALQGADGNLHTYVVQNARKMMGGRLVAVTLQREDGEIEERLLARDQDLFIMPPLPAPQPVNVPPREYVTPDRLRVGDTVRVMRGGELLDVEIATLTETDGRYGPTALMSTTDRPDYEEPISPERVYLRVARGAASADQPPGVELPADGEATPVNRREVAIGDRVTIPGFVTTTGTVLSMETIDGEGGISGTSFTILDDTGATLTVPVFDESVSRLIEANGNIVGAIQAMQQQATRDRQTREVTTQLQATHARAFRLMAERARLAVGHSREQVLTEIAAATVPLGVSGSSRIGRVIDEIRGGSRVGEARPEVDQIMRATIADARLALGTAITEAQPLPGEAEHQMLARILDQYETDPPQRHMARVARTLLDASGALDQATAPADDPDLPDGDDLRSRMAAYRQQIGGTFGHHTQRVATFGTLDLARLEAGETPEITWDVKSRRDRNESDNGPGDTAMQHLAVVRAAGRDLDTKVADASVEITAELVAKYTDSLAGDQIGGGFSDFLPTDTAESYLARARTQRDATQSRVSELSRRYRDLDDAERAEYARLRTQVMTEGTKVLRAERLVGEVRRQATYAVLSQIRDLGGERLDYDLGARTTARNRERHERLRNSTAMAEDVLPTDWIAGIRNYVKRTRNGSATIPLSETRRGGASYDGSITLDNHASRNRTLSGDAQTGVAVHELTHFAERGVPGLVEAEAAFLWSRTSTGEPGNRRREGMRNLNGHGGDRTQYGYFDEFNTPYTGVDYIGSAGMRGRTRSQEAYEVLTTGIESLFGGSDYLDDDFRQFMLGSLALLGDPKPPRENHEPIARADVAQPPAPRRRTTTTPRTGGSSRRRALTPQYRLEADRLTRMNAATPEQRKNMEDTFTYTHEGSGFRVEMNETSSYLSARRARFEGTIRDANGTKVGIVRRTVKYHQSGAIEVHHDLLTLDRQVQGQGFADAYYDHLNEQYEKMAVTEVTIQANIDVGGYAWAQRGFDWKTKRQAAAAGYRMRRRLGELQNRDDLSDAQKAAIASLTERLGRMSMGTEPWMSPKDIANSLKDVTWDHVIPGSATAENPQGQTVRMWPGKYAMLGTNWHGVLRTGVRRQPRA